MTIYKSKSPLVDSQGEAADVGKARDKDAVIETINAVEPNDGIDPALVFLELLVWQQTTSELHLGIDRPHTSAGEQIKRSVLGLDGAVRTAEGANKDFVFCFAVFEQDAERRIRVRADRCVDQIRVASETLIASLGVHHPGNVQILEDIFEARINIDGGQSGKWSYAAMQAGRPDIGSDVKGPIVAWYGRLHLVGRGSVRDQRSRQSAAQYCYRRSARDKTHPDARHLRIALAATATS